MPEHDHDFTRNVRFWITHNTSPVKLTLRPGQQAEVSNGSRTDEGFHAEGISYSYDAQRGVLELSSVSWGQDCDGRYESSWLGSCVVGDERRNELIHDGSERLWCPRWREESQSQRDMTAEAMGY